MISPETERRLLLEPQPISTKAMLADIIDGTMKIINSENFEQLPIGIRGDLITAYRRQRELLLRSIPEDPRKKDATDSVQTVRPRQPS